VNQTILSIIIPTLNEEKTLGKTLSSIPVVPSLEVIVVDGGSLDRTCEVVRTRTSHVYTTLPGRARQMNFGAQKAQGETLLFLHADSLLPEGGFEAILRALAEPRVIGGAFYLGVNASGWGYRIITFGTNLRSRWFKLPYGDQGIFIKKDIFERIGGYPEISLMEDIALVQRMKKEGAISILPQSMLTSPRRWEKEGLFYTTLRNWALVTLYLAGVHPDKLYKWYQHIR
jgi:hypothetical protein